MFALGSLLYVAFLFLPALIPRMAPSGWLLPTLISLPPFFVLYVVVWRLPSPSTEWAALGLAALGLALMPVNPAAHTYVIYAIAALSGAVGLRRAIALSALILVIYSGWHLHLGYPAMMAGITALMSIAIGVGNGIARAYGRKETALRLSQEEVRALAQLAERERIGRDLHDLLGHTLSVIVLKAELAHRLYERNPDASRREIAEVERIARDALGQVRRAVMGIRAAGLRAELAHVRLALDAAGVQLDYDVESSGLRPEQETALALIIREAVTNIIRHAGARHATIHLLRQPQSWELKISDNGRGTSGPPGSGLEGMRERAEALGGRLALDSGPAGTCLTITLPADAAGAHDSGQPRPATAAADS